MAIKTQIRLGQLTGSIGSSAGQVNDSVAKSAKASIAAADLSTVLSHLASGIKRIHGNADFSNSDPGHFHQNLHLTASLIDLNQAATIQTDAGNLTLKAANGSAQVDIDSGNGEIFLKQGGNTKSKISHAGNNILLRNMTNNADVIFSSTASGNELEVFRVDGSADSNAGAILVKDAKKIHFRDDALTIHSSANGQLDVNADTTAKVTAPTIDLEASTAVVVSNDLKLDSDSAEITFGADAATKFVHSNGNGLILDGSEAKLAFGQTDFAEAVFSSADGQLDLVAGTEIQLVAPTIDIDASSEVNVSGALTVGGDLTVNGTTTTVNSTTLTVDDNIIVLGSGNSANTKDLGLIMERGGNNVAAFLDESDSDIFKFLLTDNDGSGNTIATPSNRAALPVQVDLLHVSGSAFKVKAGLLGDGVTNALQLQTDNTLFFDAREGQISFTDSSVQSTDGFAFSIDCATDRIAKFRFSDDSQAFWIDRGNNRVEFKADQLIHEDAHINFKDGNASLSAPTASGELVYSGSSSFVVAHTTPANTGLLKIQKGDAFVGFDFDGNSSVTYSWPNAPAANNYVLQAQTNGTLAWVAQGGASNSFKGAFTHAGNALAANAALSTSSGYSAQNLSAISTANASKAVDVFVNGQLLVSGSGKFTTDTSAAGFTSGDYLAKTLTMNAFDLKFAFNLEADDVVTIIGRA